MPVVETLLVGPARPLGPRRVPSGIVKRPVGRRMLLSKLGFEGDEQGDLRHHGGPEKAVHHYPIEHYASWIQELGADPLLDRAGAFGENVSVRGLLEREVAVGDRFRLGSALVEVSQGRQPCFRLNLRIGRPDMAARMQASGRTGWYYRVVEEGYVGPGDSLTLTERLAPSWTIQRLWYVLYVDTLDRESLSEMVASAYLPERWRGLAERRLRTGAVEDWAKRLEGS